MTTLEKMLTEQTTWSLECANDDSFITIDNIILGDNSCTKKLKDKEVGAIIAPFNETNLLYTYLMLSPAAVSGLLEGRDQYFKLEKIAVTTNNVIKVYFHNIGGPSYPFFKIDKERRPSFIATLRHKSGDILKRSRILVDPDYNIHIEDVW